MVKPILVTGASGFVARNLVKHLRGIGETVVTFDIKDSPLEDITVYEKLRAKFEECSPSKVYHLAAQAFVGPGEKDPYRDLLINGAGMINMLRCVTEFKTPLLYTSSGSVYGATDSFPHAENALVRPTANYGCTKYLAELYLQKWVMTEGIDAKITRFSSVYGLDRGREGPVNVFLEKAAAGEPLIVYGDGSQTRDMVHVSDAIEGMKAVMRNGSPGEVYNIGLGEEHSVLEVAQEVHRLTGAPIKFLDKALSKFDVARSYYNIEKARHIGFTPIIGLKAGIVQVYGEMKLRAERVG
jgi:UDP-glucose 4-epimerase